MKNKVNLIIWIIAVIVAAAAVITLLLTMRTTVPIINNNGEISENPECFSSNNMIQRVLENTIKTKNEIVIMMVYSDDGTILAHFKPERIGKNMFDVDVELSDCMQEMFKAMKNKKIYRGQKYDPSLNEYIRFILKPLQINDFNHNLSLLIGISESYVLGEIKDRIRYNVILIVIAILAVMDIILIVIGFVNKPNVTVKDTLKEI